MNHPDLKASQDKTTKTEKFDGNLAHDTENNSSRKEDDSKIPEHAKKIGIALDFPRTWTFANNEQLEEAAKIIEAELQHNRKTGIKMVRDLIKQHKCVEEAYSIQMAFNKVATEDEKYELFEWMTKDREARAADPHNFASNFLDRFSLIHK